MTILRLVAINGAEFQVLPGLETVYFKFKEWNGYIENFQQIPEGIMLNRCVFGGENREVIWQEFRVSSRFVARVNRAEINRGVFRSASQEL